MGVWIETPVILTQSLKKLSHTLYGCVDWNNTETQRFLSYMSHPVWVCGLKLEEWCKSFAISGHTLYGCVDWNLWIKESPCSLCSHTLYGCVDWNHKVALKNSSEEKSHPVWVCGLKRDHSILIYCRYGVTPCMGVWIETSAPICCLTRARVTPCMGVWIETQPMQSWYHQAQVTPCMGVWIET